MFTYSVLTQGSQIFVSNTFTLVTGYIYFGNLFKGISECVVFYVCLDHLFMHALVKESIKIVK